MSAHGGCRLLIFQGGEFCIQCGARLGQHRRRDGDANQLTGRTGQQRAIPDGKETKAKIGEPTVLDESLRRKANDRVIAVPSGKLVKEICRICWRPWQLDRNQQFLRCKHGFVNTREELLCCNPALARRSMELMASEVIP